MMDKFFIALHAIQLLIRDIHMGGYHIRGIPKGLAQAVKTYLGGGEIGDAFSVNGIAAVNAFDDGVRHDNYLLNNQALASRISCSATVVGVTLVPGVSVAPLAMDAAAL